jgi:hypothetical protein
VARTLAVWLSDTHGGSNFGLMRPGVTLLREGPDGEPDPWQPEPTAVQRYLWACYQQDMERVRSLAGGDRIVVFHNGDLMQGRKYPSELVSTREADQYLIAIDNLRQWLNVPNVEVLRLCHGTGSHGFGEGTGDVLVGEQLRALYPGHNVATVRHGLASVEGVTFDYAHHGTSPGIRNWTTGNMLRHYVRSLMLDEITRGRAPARVVVRSHYHAYVRETVRVACGDGEQVTDGFVTPSYSHLTEYAAQATRSSYLITCGLVAVEVEDGRLVDVHPFTRTVDLRREETL